MSRIGAGWFTAPPQGGLVAALAALVLASSCGSTVDSVGYNGPAGIKLTPLVPRQGPNAFRDRLGKTDEEIAAKIDKAFNQLFHGDSTTESIYFPMANNQAAIKDIYHESEIRTEGIGWAMLIAVQLDKKDEFDRLWTFSKQNLRSDAPSQGYFRSRCDVDMMATVECTDPFGMEQFVTALLFARDRWTLGKHQDGGVAGDSAVDAPMPADGGPYDGGTVTDGGTVADGGTSTDGGPSADGGTSADGGMSADGGAAPDAGGRREIDYGADAIALLDVMRHKEDANHGVIKHVTNVFDAVTGLPFDLPDDTNAGRTRPSIVMPAHYELWAEATGDKFWSRAAESGRGLWKRSADPETALTPVRCTFEGAPIQPFGSFQSESYRTQINVVLDNIWVGTDPWTKEFSTRLLRFFSSKGIDNYGMAFSLNGNTQNSMREWALIAANGITALVAETEDADGYVQRIWDMPIPSQRPRYYQGLIYLNALLMLSGNYRVW